jgi:hypothetical protein
MTKLLLALLLFASAAWASFTPYRAVNTQTTSYTLTANDLGKLVVMNCSSACTATLYGSPQQGYYGAIESIGATVATVSLNSKNFNGSSSVPVLNSFRPLDFFSDGSNYFGRSPVVAGTDLAFTAASNGLTIAVGAATINAQTGTSYTLVSSDNGKIVTLSNASAITLTVPAGLGSGFNCLLVQLGAGQVTPTASSTTLHQRQSFTKTAGQYAVMSLAAYVADTFVLGGDMQ